MFAVIEDSRDPRNTLCCVTPFSALNAVSCRASRSSLRLPHKLELGLPAGVVIVPNRSLTLDVVTINIDRFSRASKMIVAVHGPAGGAVIESELDFRQSVGCVIGIMSTWKWSRSGYD